MLKLLTVKSVKERSDFKIYYRVSTKMEFQSTILILILLSFCTNECKPYRGVSHVRWRHALDSLSSSINSDLTGRIIGGRVARRAEVPYQLRLEVMVPQSMISRCGAALTQLSGVQFALTAAHCVVTEGSNPPTPIDPSKVSIIGGDHSIKLRDFEQYRYPSKIVMHENYEGPTKRSPQNDIAILFFDRPFSITRYVSTLRLPGNNWNIPSKAFVSGWGSTASIYTSTAKSDLLKVVEANTISTSVCKTYQFDPRLITNTQMCVLERGVGPCKGDSGGPAAGRNSTSNRWYLAGIVSYVQADCGDDYPSVYSRVSAYVGWIQNHVTNYHNHIKRRQRG